MTCLRVAQNVQRLAEDAFAQNKVLRSTDDFQIHELPQGSSMDGYVLFLWGEGKDFPPDRVPPGHLIIPVDVDGRKGYLWLKEAAMAYPPEAVN